MPQASPNFNLYVLKPNLVKEWHPTKNAGLKPREVTPGTKVNIRLDRPLPGSSQESYDSVIKWCKDLTNEQGIVQNFGLGVQFI
jgi:hypothetical protein